MNSRFTISILFTMISSGSSFAQTSQWPAGVNVCQGSWKYSEYESCESPSHGNDLNRPIPTVGLITLGLGSTIGHSIKAAEKGAEVFKDVAKAIEGGEDLIKVADDAADAVRAAENFGAKTVKEMENVYVDLASVKRRNHILNGDKAGGGHLYPGKPAVGGKPGKDGFPESWSGDKIMHEISDIVTDPKIEWVYNRTSEGVVRYQSIGIRDGVKIKVIVEPATDTIITAMPLDGLGVIKNL